MKKKEEEVVFKKTLKVLQDEVNKGTPIEEVISCCLPLFKDEMYRAKAEQLMKKRTRKCSKKCLFIVAVLVALLSFAAFYVTDEDWINSPCLLNHNEITEEFTRPLYNCELCKGLKNVTRVANISAQEFLVKYAYSSVPLVVTGVAKVRQLSIT